MRIFLIFAIFAAAVLVPSAAFGEKNASDPSQLFYKANIFYEKGEYFKSIDEYSKILALGLESGRLYYNIGNAYFKMGKIGQAILYYEKAKRLIPQDGDLKSNLSYARSLAGEIVPDKNLRTTILSLMQRPFRDFNLNALAIATAIAYLGLIVMLALFAINPFLYKKLALIFFVIVITFVLSMVTFAVRYYDEELVKQAVVIGKDVSAKYDPIEKSTIYYTLPEGSVVVMLDDKGPWMRIKRSDGKIGWVQAGSVKKI